MAQHRTWDESRSPQWKYFLQRESAQRRKTRKEIEKDREETKLEEVINLPTKIREKKEKKKRFFSRIEGELKEKLQTSRLKYNEEDNH